MKKMAYIYQLLYQKAMRVAGEAHGDQKVPGTHASYLLHISNVAMEVILAYFEGKAFDLELALPVAILHDTVEDTEVTYEDIQKQFGTPVADGVMALTKNESLKTKAEKMADSLERVKKQPKEIAIVKLADRITNLQKPPAHWSPEKIQNYLKEAEWIAETLKGHHAYLDQRMKVKLEEYKGYVS